MRILFIGNSHVFANGLPYQVRAMIDHALGEGACETWMSAPGGQSLAWHAAEPTTTMAIRYHAWDRIVLQQVTHPFAGYEQLASDFAGLSPHLDAAAAEVLLFMTWPRKNRQHHRAEIDAAFSRLADEQGLGLVPVSRAWQLAMGERADLELYQPDGSHASPAGTYLAACVFFGVLTGQPPEGLPARIEVAGDVLVDLATEDAADLQRIARQALAGRAERRSGRSI